MENILLVLNIIFAIILVLLILLQKSEGGALGIGVSQENFMYSRSVGNFMTKATAVVATFFIAIALGLFAVLVMLPSLADKVGAFFFSAPEQMKPDPLIKVAAKVSQGDYEGAIKAYRAIASEEPENRFPIFEIAKIQQEHLRDVDAAIETFEKSLENNEWAENDEAAILFRLQQIYLESKETSIDKSSEILSLFQLVMVIHIPKCFLHPLHVVLYGYLLYYHYLHLEACLLYFLLI